MGQMKSSSSNEAGRSTASIKTLPYIFETVSYIQPVDKTQWNEFINLAIRYTKSKAGTIFEVDNKNKRIAIHRISMPIKEL